MELPDYDLFDRQYDEMMANPGAAEHSRDTVLTTDEFVVAFRRCVKNFRGSIEALGHEVPRSTVEADSYDDDSLWHLQRRARFTWGGLGAFLDDWLAEQIQQIESLR